MTLHIYSENNVRRIRQQPPPRVLLNVCTHGSERVGLKVAAHFSKLKPVHGTLVINIANEAALAKRKRFIDSDLNRIFPGKPDGDTEERLAHRMLPFIRSFDIVIDVHSTETGARSIVIVTKYDKKLAPLLKAIAPKRIVLMSATKSNALISQAKAGIAFEYGKDADPTTYKQTVIGIERALTHLGLIENLGKSKGQGKRTKPEFFEATTVLKKPEGFVIYRGIKNFKIVQKGDTVAKHAVTGNKIHAPKDFYPVLFGKNTYTSIFGFMAKKRKW